MCEWGTNGYKNPNSYCFLRSYEHSCSNVRSATFVIVGNPAQSRPNSKQ